MKKPLLAAILAMSGLPLLAGPLFDGNGFAFGPRDCLRFSPMVSVGAFWETNARDTSHDTKAGGGWRVQPSFSLSYAGKEGVKDLGSFSLSGFYSMERGFDSDNAQDSDSYGLSISTRRKITRNLTFSASASYSRSENDEFYGDTWNDYGIPRIDENRSESYNANAAIGYQGDKWRWSAGLGWSRTKQLDGYKNESDSYSLSLTAGRAVFARHYWNLSFSTTWDDADENSQAYYIRTGMSGSISQKLTYSTLVGVGIYDYSGYEDDTAFGPSYDVSVAYKINRTFAASLALSSQFEPEYDGNQQDYYIWSNRLTGAINAQWSERWSSRLNVAWSYEEHQGNNNEADYDRTYIQTSLSTSYVLNRFTSLYGTVSWKNDMYSDGDDTDDLRLDIGLSFHL
ncbi:MAG: hypothetical protein MSB12_00520 [Lentisphaeraceae bacterium]|nr:hypothetical protein [Lentisphaeraceae bacterium]